MYLLSLKVKRGNFDYVLPLYESELKQSTASARDRFNVILTNGLDALPSETRSDSDVYVLVGPPAFAKLCNLYFPPMLPSTCFDANGKLEVDSAFIDGEIVSEDCRHSYLSHLYTSFLLGTSVEFPKKFSTCVTPHV